jgi:adenylosuccinate synthase
MSSHTKLSQVTAVLGSQWGDEGKGKIVDILGPQFAVCARYNGGANAGHTIVVGKQKFAFHLMPSGILNPKCECLIGHGCVVHIQTLFNELKSLDSNGVDYKGRIFISDRAHIVLDLHMKVDGLNEEELATNKEQIGTTRKGIGPSYCEKMNRSGIRVDDLRNMKLFRDKLTSIVKSAKKRFPSLQVDIDALVKEYEELAAKLEPMIVDGIHWINERHSQGKTIMIEGANAAMLDIDFGTYPYVTSSNPTVGGCITGLGISAKKIGDVIGVVKAYTTRVGEGPFPTELLDDIGAKLRKDGAEFGTTTGRPRRCGWLDTVILKYSTLINGYTALNLTKLDILTGLKEIKIGVAYKYQGQVVPSVPASLDILSKVQVQYETLPGWTEDISQCKSFSDLPPNCQQYVKRVQELAGVPIRWIGTGPKRDQMIEC